MTCDFRGRWGRSEGRPDNGSAADLLGDLPEFSQFSEIVCTSQQAARDF
jgi:hypothetical protein